MNTMNMLEYSSTQSDLMYPNNAAPVATRRTAAESSDAFTEGLSAIARKLLFSVPDLAPGDKQLLKDFARADARYPMKTLQRLITLSEHSTRPEDREALAELVRSRVIRGAQTPTVPDAFDVETVAQGLFNVEKRSFERHPDPVTKDRCVEAGTRELAAARAALDAVLAAPV
jgi:hypothetical protein